MSTGESSVGSTLSEWVPGVGELTLSRTIATLFVILVVVGVLTGLVASGTTVIGFEEYTDGVELTTQYENSGVTFEPQGDESAGAIVITCGPNVDDCTQARNGENVIRTPTAFEVEQRPLVVTFTEPKQAVGLFVRELAWYDGTLDARLVARDSTGNVVASSEIQFDSDTGWHRIAVTTASPRISRLTLTMTDSGQTAEHNYFIVDDLSAHVNEAPTAAFTYTSDAPSVGETVTFDASQASDSDGEIVEYRWDFDGDGSVDQVTQTAGASTTYDEPGTHTVILEVEDDDGATDSIPQILTVSSDPVARCSISDSEVEPGEQVVIDASDSTADRVRFDIDGDGRFERVNEVAFRETVRYSDAGLVRPIVRAESGEQSDTVRCGAVTVAPTGLGIPLLDVAIGVAGGTLGIWALRRVYRPVRRFFEDNPNSPPIPNIAYVPSEPSPVRPVMLDGTLSTDPDPDDRIVTYRWNVEDNELTDPRFVHAFVESGEYEVELQVVDSRGAIGSLTETIMVEERGGELELAHVHPDAPGNDHENLDQEYLVFENTGTGPLDIGGWTVHDAAEEQDRVAPGQHTFEFPEDIRLEPGDIVAIHTGSGEYTSLDSESGGLPGSSGEAHHLFWDKPLAVWNNDEDAVVVQDDEENPVTALRYKRTETGEYEVKPLEPELLEDWFPVENIEGGEVSSLIGLDPIERVRESTSNIRGFIAGSIFLRGPKTFLACWATITGFLIAGSMTWGASTSIGVVSPSFEPILLLLLMGFAILMLVIGVVWLLVSMSVSTIWGWLT